MTKEERHLEVMRKIAENLSGTPYVLKGGTALVLTRGLQRHSTDLDFDAPKPLNIVKYIRRGLAMARVNLLRLRQAKDTHLVQRYKVHYSGASGQEDVLLKIETSFRNPPDAADVETIEGIQTYKIAAIFDQKLSAFENRCSARDLYDLAYLTSHFGSDLSEAQVGRIDAMTSDLDALIDSFRCAFLSDEALSTQASVEEVALELRESVEELAAVRRSG